MNIKHEISCWQCNEMTSLETRNEFDGCCWACGVEIDLEDYLIKAMDKRDEHYAALSAVTAERDAALASLERAYANYNQVSYASTERGKQIDQLRSEVEALRDLLREAIEAAGAEVLGIHLLDRIDAAMDAKEE